MPSSAAYDATGVRTTTPWISDLAAGIREVLRRDLTPHMTACQVAELLRPSLGRPGLLSAAQQEGCAETYRQHLLYAEPDGSFSVVALVWLPGQRTPIHDHLSWCVAGVHQGQETEHRYRPAGDDPAAGLVRDGSTVNPTGALSAIAPPGDIHRVCNTGPTKAISLHIYGADISRLGSSVRRTYDAPHDEP
ncbi:cysteine dioxygenase [Streptacidiphilus anmyonensis]|uniref:cysteine dioxygenase n=1 Tax=Streptacidiphilus anmyonensis TaxID=405782 RepID=UPI000A67BA2D